MSLSVVYRAEALRAVLPGTSEEISLLVYKNLPSFPYLSKARLHQRYFDFKHLSLARFHKRELIKSID